jgi:hypothetical protein
MSDNFLRFVPIDPTFVPDRQNQIAAQAMLREWLPAADRVTITVDEHVRFVDQGSNFEGVFCPVCGIELSMEWWQAAMDRASDVQFSDLRVIVPCCSVATSLNDLRYEMPAGFGRFVLEAQNPNVPDLPADQLRQLKFVLGCAVRVIWTHY